MAADNSTERLLNYKELILTLKGLCREQRSGIMVINSEAGCSAKIMLDQGEIFDVNCRGASGRTALLLIKKVKQGKASFFKCPPGHVVKNLDLATTEIFRILETVDVTENVAAVEAQSQEMSSKPRVETAVEPEAGMTVIEAHLAQLIGPVAKMIYENYDKEVQNSNSLEDLNAVVEKIAKESLNTEQQKILKQNMRSFVGQYGLSDGRSILEAFKSKSRDIKLNLPVLSLLLDKYSTHGELGASLLTKLAMQLENSGNLAGALGLSNVLRFLEKTTKTGTLNVRLNDKKGCFYFNEGVLVNAVRAEKEGIEAALELLKWQPDYMLLRIMEGGGSHAIKIHQTVEMLEKELNNSSDAIISKKEGEKYAHIDKAVSSADQIQIALAKEIERRQSKMAQQKEGGKPEGFNDEQKIQDTIHLIECFRYAEAERIIVESLKAQDDNYQFWLWFSRIANHMTAIEFALKKAAFIKNTEIAEDIKKFTQARKIIKHEFVLRCPFCWMPVNKTEVECTYCQAGFFIDANFFSKTGRAKVEVLDEAISRYNRALQQDLDKTDNIYLHFYLAMAYVNRRYYQEGLEQFNDILNNVPSTHPFASQGKRLAKYMRTAGLVSDVKTVTENAGEKRRVLVVEDSLVTRKVIARALVANGYEVFEAKDADEALDNIEEKQLNLVLLDIILPGRDGYEILAEIRSKPVLAKIPVIMLTSRDSLFDKIKGKVSDADEYLTKPFQPDELLTVVKKYLK